MTDLSFRHQRLWSSRCTGGPPGSCGGPPGGGSEPPGGGGPPVGYLQLVFTIAILAPSPPGGKIAI